MTSTKQLARKLGLVRKRGTCHSNGKKVKRLSAQVYDYLVVLDFEATCWKDKRKRSQEIIEFPVVLLNTANGEIEAEFHHYVQPQENPTLSDFCRELTGITQDQVDSGIPLSVSIVAFVRWLSELSQKMGLCIGPDGGGQKAIMMVTWSDWDLGVCLYYECKRKQIRRPRIFDSWIDLRATYRNFYSRKPEGLCGALNELGIGFVGREHSGIDDARNTAQLCWKMIEDGCSLQVTRTQTSENSCVVVRPVGQPSDQSVSRETTPITPTTSRTVTTNGMLGCCSNQVPSGSCNMPQHSYSPGNSALFHGKITPPLCGCGRRSIRREVSAGGPNQGRAFYSCSRRRSSNGTSCAFFQWEAKHVASRTPSELKSSAARSRIDVRTLQPLPPPDFSDCA